MISWALAYAAIKTKSPEIMPLIIITGFLDVIVTSAVVGLLTK